MFQVALSYLAVAVISFFQGYTFVPQYTYCFAALTYFIRSHYNLFEEGKNPISLVSLFCEIFSLTLALGFLVFIYLAYFKLAFVPEHTNKVWLALFVVGFIVFRVKQEIELSEERSRAPIYVDFRHLDEDGRVRMDSFWTLRDIERYLIRLEEGVMINVYGPVKRGKANEQTLFTSGVVQRSEKTKNWVLRIDWDQELDKARRCDSSDEIPSV